MTGLDLRHIFEWVLIVAGVAAMLGGYYVFLEWIGDLTELRMADTPEPERRRQSKAVIQFPRKEWQR